MGSRRSLSTAPEEQTLKTLGKEKAATGNGIPAPWAGMTSHSHAPGTGQVLLMLSALWPHQHTPPMVGPCSASRVWGEHPAPAQAGRERREENPPWGVTEYCTGWTGSGSCSRQVRHPPCRAWGLQRSSWDKKQDFPSLASTCKHLGSHPPTLLLPQLSQELPQRGWGLCRIPALAFHSSPNLKLWGQQHPPHCQDTPNPSSWCHQHRPHSQDTPNPSPWCHQHHPHS